MSIELTAAIIAVVNVIKMVPQVGDKVTGVVTPLIALFLGVGFAFVNGGNLLEGAIAGLAAVGVHTVARNVGLKSK